MTNHAQSDPPGAGAAPPPVPTMPPRGDATGGLIPYKNAPALTAYYLGVFSVIPCLGIPLGIAAVILGILGLRRAARRPEVKGKVHAWIGIVLGALFALVYLTGVALLFVIPALTD